MAEKKTRKGSPVFPGGERKESREKALVLPLWNTIEGLAGQFVNWVAHQPNKRFAIFDPGTPGSRSDDLVLDRETGLVWSRDANLLGASDWLNSNTLCRELQLGNRAGWRLPAVEELASLVDPSQPDLALPPGHPFVNVQYGSGIPAYWSSTNYENPTGAAWFVNFWRGSGPHLTGIGIKSINGFAWPVRGGAGGNNWNW